LNNDEIREFEQWISSSAENLELFNEYRNIWLATAAGISAGKFDPAPAWEKVHNRIDKSDGKNRIFDPFRDKRMVMRALRIAAMLILFMSAGATGSWIVFSKQKINQADSYVEIVAPKGSKSQITLPDGSRAWINAGSKLSYMGDFNKSDRVVNLEGEGFFTVTSNKAKPFIVQTAHLRVKAFGTVFNVKAYPDEKTVETTLVEGVVEIEAKGRTRSDETQTYTLRPKQNIVYHIESGLAEQKSDNITAKEQVPVKKAEVIEKEIQVKNNIKPELYTSWKDENWVIEGMPLDQLAVLMGRRFNSMIVIRDDALKLYKFTGTIQNETLEQMLVILSLTTPLEYSIGKGNVSWMLNRNLERNYTRILKR
jgi:ferric-dicitrate binding protein FerR (iron transport regulator)